MANTNSKFLTIMKSVIFWSRWLQGPLYLGLIVAQGVYVYQLMTKKHGTADA